MKTIILSLSAIVMLSACATAPTGYGPAQGKGIGFTQQQIEKDRFQVSFTGRNVEEARNFALLRAAEITLDNGYDNFQIIGGDTYGDRGRRSPISSSVGVGIGSGGYGRGINTNIGLGLGVGDVGRMFSGKKVTSSLEILLSRGNAGSTNQNVYEARSVVKSIRPPIP